MTFYPGQGILGRIAFVDGQIPAYDRTYLIVNVETDYIEVLNVSSIQGKSHKLAFQTNERLQVFNLPFLKPSFVKLDSLTKVYTNEWGQLKLLNRGRQLDSIELNRIRAMIIN